MIGTEVWLYGSAARGDQDEASDVDLLIIGEDPVDLDPLGLADAERLSPSCYSWPEVEHMADYGSLFLHHIKLEGKPLVESDPGRMREILRTLGPYSRGSQELNCFRTVLDDVEGALEQDHSNAFELSVVATAARHAAILGCYLVGRPTFGRESAFRVFLPRLGYSTRFTDEMIRLYRYRRAEDMGRPLEAALSAEDVRQAVRDVRRMIGEVEALLV